MAASRRNLTAISTLALLGLALTPLSATAEMRPSLNFSGMPGVIDMPSGEALADGNFGLAVSNFGPITRNTLSFQITPWLGGSFRLQTTRNWNDLLPSEYTEYSDRSFDLRFRLLKESTYLPAVTLGLQDFAGTGLFSGEYVAATKTFDDRIKVTAGLGWGRYGTYNAIGSPFGERPPITDVGTGSKLNPNTWFRGPAALFGGLEWRVTDNWIFKAEYSSDAYVLESGKRGTFERKSPLNFGVEYSYGDTLRLGAYSLYGSEIGLALNMVLDPKNRLSKGIAGPAPVHLGTRPDRRGNPGAWDTGWTEQPNAATTLRGNLSAYLAPDGILIESFSQDARRVQVRIRNTQIDAGAQAIGRTARALSHVMPASVEVFEIVPVVNGMAASRVVLRRSDLEALEYAGGNADLLRSRVTFAEAGPRPEGSIGPEAGTYPRLKWSIRPTARISDPQRGAIGAQLSGSYEIAPGLILSGSLYKSLFDNLDGDARPVEYSGLARVRSDVRLYNRADLSMDRLTLAWYAHPADAIYTRLTFGYLERMHAGVSAEVLWKPVNSRFALGAEVNYTKQRATDGGFGFGYDHQLVEGGPFVPYSHSIATGHLSAYYDFGNGYLGQLDAGRYLAGDVGATVTLSREFANGWKVGAFATMTNASTADFGEGSFDKGLQVTVPMNWLFGKPTRAKVDQTIRPLQRDGGARVDVQDRLYDTIRDQHGKRIDDQWSRVWR